MARRRLSREEVQALDERMRAFSGLRLTRKEAETLIASLPAKDREVMARRPRPENFGGVLEHARALWDWEGSDEVRELFEWAAEFQSAPMATEAIRGRSAVLLYLLKAWDEYGVWRYGDYDLETGEGWTAAEETVCPRCGQWPHRDTCHSRWRPYAADPPRRRTGGKATTKSEAIADMQDVGEANCSNQIRYQNARDPSRHVSDRNIRDLFGGWPAARRAAFGS